MLCRRIPGWASILEQTDASHHVSVIQNTKQKEILEVRADGPDAAGRPLNPGFAKAWGT